MPGTTQQILEHHLKAFGDGDLEVDSQVSRQARHSILLVHIDQDELLYAAKDL